MSRLTPRMQLFKLGCLAKPRLNAARVKLKKKRPRGSFMYLVGWARLELATNGLKVRCSNQLSYQPQARYYDFLLFYCQTTTA